MNFNCKKLEASRHLEQKILLQNGQWDSTANQTQ